MEDYEFLAIKLFALLILMPLIYFCRYIIAVAMCVIVLSILFIWTLCLTYVSSDYLGLFITLLNMTMLSLSYLKEDILDKICDEFSETFIKLEGILIAYSLFWPTIGFINCLMDDTPLLGEKMQDIFTCTNVVALSIPLVLIAIYATYKRIKKK